MLQKALHGLAQMVPYLETLRVICFGVTHKLHKYDDSWLKYCAKCAHILWQCLLAAFHHSCSRNKKRRLQIEASAKQSSQPPVSLRGQLLWREFFYFVGANTPNFDQMEGNPICKQIPWEDNADKITAWEAGKTGFPWLVTTFISQSSC